MGFRCLYCHKKCYNATWGELFRCKECGSTYIVHFDWGTGKGKMLRAEGPCGEDLLEEPHK